MSIIYKVECINNKIYIGQTIKTLNIRKSQHLHQAFYKNNQAMFYKALRKYGKENFKWKVLEKSKSRDKINELEIYYIKKYKSYFKENGYNMTFGGHDFPSDKLKELWKNPEFRKKHAKATGKATKKSWKDPIIRKKRSDGISKARKKQYKEDKEYYKKISTHLKHQAQKNWDNPKTRKKLIKERSNIWELISPKGKKYKICGGKDLKEFCNIHNLSNGCIYNYYRENKKYKGWEIKILKLAKRYENTARLR